MTTKNTTPPVDLEPLFGFWDALIDCDSAEGQLIALNKLKQELKEFKYGNPIFSEIVGQQHNKAWRRDLIGFYVEAAFPEDNGNDDWQIKRRFLASFTAEQETQMVVFLEAWLDEHWHGQWEREKSYGEPLYNITKNGTTWGIRAFSVRPIQENSLAYERWQQGLSLMAAQETSE